ncbi:MAG: LysR family transcriptional regulator [Janthinobacterium lividum]
MESFVAVVETGSLSGAAARLGLSNAAVTAQLQGLEVHLHATLLHRNTRRLGLTEEGERFLARSRAILAAMADAEAEAGGDAVRGVLRVQVPIAVGHLVLAPALAAFARRYPDLRVVTVLENQVNRPGSAAPDMAIRIDEVEAADLVARPIYRSMHGVYAAPSLLAERGRPRHPGEIDPACCLGWVETTSGPPRPWRLRHGAETAVIHPAGPLFFNSTDALLQAAAQGAGFVYLLDLLAHHHLRTGQLVAVLPEWETEEQVFYITYPRTRFLAPKTRVFADFVAHAFPEHVRPPARSTVRVRAR